MRRPALSEASKRDNDINSSDDDSGGTRTITRITIIGKVSLQSAVTKIKRSYFEAIQAYGLVKNSPTAKNFAKLKLSYVNSTLPMWLHSIAFRLQDVVGGYAIGVTGNARSRR